MKIAVVGSGGWGCALAVLLTKNGHDVTLWSFFSQEYEELAGYRENKKMLPGVKFPDALKLTDDLSVISDAEIVVTAVPSFAVRATAEKIAKYISKNAIIVNVSKGIDAESGKRLTQTIEEFIPKSVRVVALSGPSHAEEVGRGLATAVIAASKSREAAERVQDAFMQSNFRVYILPDVIGVELSGALKNIIALAAGICDGIGTGDNTKAALITRGLAEISRLGVALGGNADTFSGLAGIGDLIVTCTSMHSRNHRAGILIGEGIPTQEALKRVGAVVEGYYATQAALKLAREVKVEMPITEQVYSILFDGKEPTEALDELMCRDKKSESESCGWNDEKAY